MYETKIRGIFHWIFKDFYHQTVWQHCVPTPCAVVSCSGCCFGSAGPPRDTRSCREHFQPALAMAAPGLFDLELQEEDAIECDQSDDDAIEVEEVSAQQGRGTCPAMLLYFCFGCPSSSFSAVLRVKELHEGGKACQGPAGYLTWSIRGIFDRCLEMSLRNKRTCARNCVVPRIYGSGDKNWNKGTLTYTG